MRRINEEISSKIVQDLKSGILRNLLKKVQQDDTLELEFRENYMSIYYRGGCVSKLQLSEDNFYDDYFDNNYKKPSIEISEEEEDTNQKFQMRIKDENGCNVLINEINKRKEVMNSFFAKKPKREREYQQLVERENNDREDSNFYVADIEYAKDNNRFDMLAVQRKDHNDYNKLKLSIIEMKYGQKAIGKKCGLYDHYQGVKNLSADTIRDIIKDTESIIKYKYDLGLIKTTKYIERGIKINILDEIDLIFFISGITQKHNKVLLEELEQICNDIENSTEEREIKLNVKVFCPYMAGNIMYDKDVISLEKFKMLTEFIENNN